MLSVSSLMSKVSENPHVCLFPMLLPVRISKFPSCSQVSYCNVAMLMDEALPPFYIQKPWVIPSIPGTGCIHLPSISESLQDVRLNASNRAVPLRKIANLLVVIFMLFFSML